MALWKSPGFDRFKRSKGTGKRARQIIDVELLDRRSGW